MKHCTLACTVMTVVLVACGSSPNKAIPPAPTDAGVDAHPTSHVDAARPDAHTRADSATDSGPPEGRDAGGEPPLPPLPSGAGTGTTYYVSPNGADTNDGKSPAKAWQTIGKVNAATFTAGDSVLLEGGASFSGCLSLTAAHISSTAMAPLTVGSYGTGRFTMNANCSGSKAAAVSLSGINGIVLRDCIIAGNSGGAEYGIWINNPSSATTEGVRIQSCDISGFYAAGTDYGAEIFIDGIPGGLSDIDILDNTLHGANGPTSSDDNGVVGYGDGMNITNVLYQGNTIYDIGGRASGGSGVLGNGIVVNGVDGAVVQYNVAHDCGGNTTTCGGPAGLWAYSSNNVTIQFNEVYRIRPIGSSPGCDWDGYDLDGFVTNSTGQYNYAHDNHGDGYLLYITGPWSGNTYRYNIGQNDGTEISFGGNAASTSDVAVYNNTFFGTAGTSFVEFGITGGGTVSGLVANNIFYADGGMEQFVDDLSWNTATVTGVSFLRNDYFTTGTFGITWGGMPFSSLATWVASSGQEKSMGSVVGLSVDPKLQHPGSGGTLGGYVPSALSGYLLESGSPMIGKGLTLTTEVTRGVGKQDFFGDKIPGAQGYNLGADGAAH
jgi:hypothetical protein